MKFNFHVGKQKLFVGRYLPTLYFYDFKTINIVR